MVRHPRPAIAVVASRRPLGPPHLGARRREDPFVDPWEVERGDLVGVGHVRRLVGLDEGRLLQGEEGADGQERDDDPDQPDDVGRDAPGRAGAPASSTASSSTGTFSLSAVTPRWPRGPRRRRRRRRRAPLHQPAHHRRALHHAVGDARTPRAACSALDTPTPTSTGLSVMRLQPRRPAPWPWRPAPPLAGDAEQADGVDEAPGAVDDARQPLVGRGRRGEHHRLDAGVVGGRAPRPGLLERQVGQDAAGDAGGDEPAGEAAWPSWWTRL